MKTARLGSIIVIAASLSGWAGAAWAANGATFISQTVATVMTTGSTQVATVTMQNSGTSTWTAANRYNLGPQNPQDNCTWLISTSRVGLDTGDAIAPGQSKTFTFVITAPSTPGTYDFQWRMVQDTVEWFGAFTTNLVITVNSPPTPTFTPTVSPTPTHSPTPTNSSTPTVTPSRTLSRTPTPTRTVTRTATQSPTITPTCTRTETPAISTPTWTATAHMTVTPLVPAAGEVVAYPSPAKGGTVWFYYSIAGSCRIEIQVFNLLGEKVALLKEVKNSRGFERTAWNVEHVASGVYLYRMKINGDDGGERDLGLKRLVIVK